MRSADRTAYIVGCIREAGSMYPQDAERFLAEHNADHRAEVLAEAADELVRIADAVEARVAEHFGAASGIGPGSAAMVREAAHSVRDLAGKDTRKGESTHSQWQAIVDALNAAASADIHIGIDVNGSSLTDFSGRSITYHRLTARWLVVCTDCDRPLTPACGHCPVCEFCLNCGFCSGTGCTCKCEVSRG